MNVPTEIEVLLEGLDEDSITSILTKWKEIVEVRKQLNEFEDMLKNKVKIYLKERKWDRYMDDETQISVSISKQKRQTIDKEQLKMVLSEAQMATVLKVTTFEKMSIMTPEMRQNLKKFVKPK